MLRTILLPHKNLLQITPPGAIKKKKKEFFNLPSLPAGTQLKLLSN